MVEEDSEGRVVIAQNPNGTYTLGDFDGEISQVRTRHFPIVTGDGTGTTTKSKLLFLPQSMEVLSLFFLY